MRTRQIAALSLGAALSLAAIGCGTVANQLDRGSDRMMDRATDRAADKVGQEVGDRMAGAMLANLGPAMMAAYTDALFPVLFYHGGVQIDETTPYEPGQFTVWQAKGLPQGERFERALLARMDDGKEWWRVESRGAAKEGEPVELIMEALLSPANEMGGRDILRMRAIMPGEKEAREIPVSENSSSYSFGAQSKRLTKESLEGMTVNKMMMVTVPAGEFRTKQIKMDGYAGGSKLEWFLADGVPGGIVKYGSYAGDETEAVYEVELVESGEGKTTSKLGVELPAAEGADPSAS